MTTAEKVLFFVGFVVVWGYPIAYFLISGMWFLLAVYALLTTSFFTTLKMFWCSKCMNFACPLNGVPDSARVLFWERNPTVASAWGVNLETEHD